MYTDDKGGKTFELRERNGCRRPVKPSDIRHARPCPRPNKEVDEDYEALLCSVIKSADRKSAVKHIDIDMHLTSDRCLRIFILKILQRERAKPTYMPVDLQNPDGPEHEILPETTTAWRKALEAYNSSLPETGDPIETKSALRAGIREALVRNGLFRPVETQSLILRSVIVSGSAADLERLLEGMAPAQMAEIISCTDDSGANVLHAAAEKGDGAKVRALLTPLAEALDVFNLLRAPIPRQAAAASATASGNNRTNLLHLAAKRGHAEVAKALLERFSTDQAERLIYARDEQGATALALAKDAGHKEVVKTMTAVVGIPDQVPEPAETNSASSSRDSGQSEESVVNRRAEKLCAAVISGDPKMVEHLAAADPATLWVLNADGSRLLDNAVLRGDTTIVKILATAMSKFLSEKEENYPISRLRNEFSIVDSQGGTALHVAAQRGQSEMVSELLGAFPELYKVSWTADDGNNRTPLHIAAELGYAEVAAEILNKAPDSAKLRDQKGNTSLHVAASAGHAEVAATILHVAPESADLRNRNDATPLHAAVLHNHPDVVAEIVDLGSQKNVNTVDSPGNTPQQIAASHGYIEIVKILDDKFKDHYRTPGQGNTTAVHLAARQGHVEVVDYYISRYKNCFQLVDRDFNTPLHYAVTRGEGAEVARLIADKCPASLDFRNVKGLTPAAFARIFRQHEIASELEQRAAGSPQQPTSRSSAEGQDRAAGQ